LDKEFAALYHKYKQGIFSYVYYLSGDRATAEEICQDVFLKVYLNIARFEGKSSFKTWIYKIARNTYLDFIKSSKGKEHGRWQELSENLVDKRQGPEELAISHERQGLIAKTLSKMDDRYRTFVILRDIQQLSYREICDITGHDMSRVKVGIYRARREFRKIYEELEGK
jgi:RNA polymerase sigma-70 factor (ECF subfamily)